MTPILAIYERELSVNQNNSMNMLYSFICHFCAEIYNLNIWSLKSKRGLSRYVKKVVSTVFSMNQSDVFVHFSLLKL